MPWLFRELMGDPARHSSSVTALPPTFLVVALDNLGANYRLVKLSKRTYFTEGIRGFLRLLAFLRASLFLRIFEESAWLILA